MLSDHANPRRLPPPLGPPVASTQPARRAEMPAEAKASVQIDCSATWHGGQCNRKAISKGLCSGHYGQRRRCEQRGQPVVFTPLKGLHGADPRDLVPVTIHVPAADADVMVAEAERLKVPVVKVYRDAVHAYAANVTKLDDER